MSFIEQLSEEILVCHKTDLDKLCIVFPTRRAALFLKKELSNKLTDPIWMPTILSIQDFIQELSPLKIEDSLTLLFDVFKIYNKYIPEEYFDSFYTWGMQVLIDFNEIDKALVNTETLFKRIIELKEIEDEFQLDEEQLEYLIKFWKSISDKDLTHVQKEFLYNWELLHKVYVDFQNFLFENNKTYEGKAYKFVSENIEEYQKNSPWDKIIFAGFYALSKAEKNIFNKLLNIGKAEIYYDADNYYLTNKKQEAGKFFSKIQSQSEQFKWNGNYFETIPKQIIITGVPLQIGQAKAASNDLESLIKNKEINLDDTAMVLADENLLFSVLSSLPTDIENINVTMGYPLNATPLFGLLELLLSLNKNRKKGVYYHHDIVNVLNHPYIKHIEQDKINIWMEDYRKNNWIYISSKHLESLKSNDLSLLFLPIDKSEDVFDYLLDILLMIRNNISDNNIESEFIYHFYCQLKRFQDIISEQKVHLSIDSFWKLFKEIINTTAVPFTGEPLKGLQVMGFLETRALDFKNVFILSMNENILPKKKSDSSFIPYNLRKTFGIPTGEDQDAIYAYHFYRLLQRAENIYLYYNTEIKSITGGEKSRYLLQLEHELAKQFPNSITIKKQLLTTDIINIKPKEITIQKSEDILDALKKYTGLENETTKHFSASALSSYIACTLKFYFHYIAGLKEQDEVEDDIDAATFGKIFHQVMQHIYSQDSTYDKDTIAQLKHLIAKITDEAIINEYAAIEDLEGRNLLLQNVIKELVSRVLEADMKSAPFVINGLEQEIHATISDTSGQKINFKGILDRIETKDSITRIIDYKTGKVELKETDLENVFTDPKHKFVFQTMFYAWMYRQQNPTATIKTGIYPLKQLSDGILWLNKGAAITPEDFQNFEQSLKTLIEGLFDATKPFTQTTDKDQCIYCPYKNLCNR